MEAAFDAIDRQDHGTLRRTLSCGNVNTTNSDGYTPLYYACMKKGVGVSTVKEILQLGAQTDLKGSDLETPLYIACFNGKRDVAQLLLERGANPNVVNGGGGETVLHLASRIGDAALIEIILAKGGDINARNSRKETPLFVAAKAGFHEVVYRLLRADAKTEVCDIDGKSPLYIASERNMKHVVILLKSEAKDLNIAKAAADDILRSIPAPLKTTEEIRDEAALEGSGVWKIKHEVMAKEVKKEMKPLDIIEIVVPHPRGDVRDLLGGAGSRGPCLSLEEVGYDAPPVVPPSLRNLPPVKPQRIGGTMMRIGTSIDTMGVEPVRIDTVPGDTMEFSLRRD
ncbi:ankyrin, putative [Trypanosoma equiperdum]|uniref:Ankyrin, putative n=2 Tax=Trypanozoon TaxID=39700 RepID=Q580E5_TRYB2|nr:ankyrin, putative [Trypanosoma brucei brucei TREU927]AAX80911.1 ankyrin, putative [Trypanosoma brucei]AAZ10708.1 ankyrin, putative [Trypanosoma brucei brucei TREU927]SCU72427.1 ankyrin, putative [Trypanosoma equiperdum]